MGAGKTSVGRRVAKALGESFTDTDAVIVQGHGPIDAIFRTEGEPAFRRIERDVVRDAVLGAGVVSLGGGAIIDPDTRADLQHCDVVLLTVSPHVVAGRVQGSARPLLTGEDPLARWVRLYEEREPLYRSVADVTFDTSHGPLQEVVDAIVSWAQTRKEPQR